jgi:hypothetical protein
MDMSPTIRAVSAEVTIATIQECLMRAKAALEAILTHLPPSETSAHLSTIDWELVYPGTFQQDIMVTINSIDLLAVRMATEGLHALSTQQDPALQQDPSMLPTGWTEHRPGSLDGPDFSRDRLTRTPEIPDNETSVALAQLYRSHQPVPQLTQPDDWYWMDPAAQPGPASAHVVSATKDDNTYLPLPTSFAEL